MENMQIMGRRIYRIPRKFVDVLDTAEFVFPDHPIPGILLLDATMLGRIQELANDPAFAKQFQVLVVPM